MMERRVPVDRIRNIGIVAHIDAGRSTVAERILFYAGRIHRIGEVYAGATTTDWVDVDGRKAHPWTASPAITCEWKAHRLNVIDTPGHVDFTADVERSLRVLDGAVALFCAVGGVEPQSATAWHQAETYRVPRIAFINKMDRAGADFYAVVDQIRHQLGANPVPIVLPIGSEDRFVGLVDLIKNSAVFYDVADQGVTFHDQPIPADLVDEAARWRAHLIAKIGELNAELPGTPSLGATPSEAELNAAVRAATIAGRIVPVLCGAAFKNKGVQRLLDAIVHYLPSPVDLPPIHTADGNTIEASEDGHLAALAFKVVTNQNAGKLVFFRVYQGVMRAGEYVYNATRDQRQRVGRLLRIHPDRQEHRDEIYTGDIGVAIGLSDTATGDTLCDENHPVVLEAIEFPTQVVAIAVTPADHEDRDQLSAALTALSAEDPTFHVDFDAELQQTLVSGVGEQHLTQLVGRMRDEFGVRADVSPPRVAFRETLTGPVQVDHRYAKQASGRGQYAHIVIRVEPTPGHAFEFVNAITGGVIPREFIPSVEKGLIDAMQRGPYSGSPVVDLRVTLLDGSYHDVDSSDIAFRICAQLAMREVFDQGTPQLLEPVMAVYARVLDEHCGAATADLCARRGRIQGMSRKGLLQEIHAMAPLAGLFGYADGLRTLTSGHGHFTLNFEHYEAVPFNLAEETVVQIREARAAREKLRATT